MKTFPECRVLFPPRDETRVVRLQHNRRGGNGAPFLAFIHYILRIGRERIRCFEFEGVVVGCEGDCLIDADILHLEFVRFLVVPVTSSSSFIPHCERHAAHAERGGIVHRPHAHELAVSHAGGDRGLRRRHERAGWESGGRLRHGGGD